MKKLLLLPLLCISAFIFGQGNPMPNYQQFGNSVTLTDFKGAPRGVKGVVIGRYADTTTANNNAIGNYIKFYPGAFIVTDNPRDELWQRNHTATAWINRGSVNITTINFLTDSSVVFCFGNGVCDTVTMNNFATTVNNIVQNFIDSSVFTINDSTLIICNGPGSCDTITLGNSNTYNIFFDSTSNNYFLVTCDTVQNICIGDSCYQQQVCDTILIPRPPTTVYQSGVRKLPGSVIVEHGNDAEGESNMANLLHNTWLYTNHYLYTIQGRPVLSEVVKVQQKQWSQLSPSIMSWNAYGKYPETLLDANNPVSLYLNYTNPFHADTIGYMGNRYGYMFMTNSKGRQENYAIDDMNAKQVGIFFDTYTENDEGVSIFAQAVPSSYNFGNTPMVDSTLLSKRVMIFKTDQDYRVPNYPNTRNDGAAALAFYPDATGNVKLGPVAGSGNITIINDTTFVICSFGDFLCDTFITTTVNFIQFVRIINDSTIVVCDSLNTCDTLVVTHPSGFDRGYFDPNQTSNADTYHDLNMNNFSVGINLITNPSGALNFNFLNGNTVSGNENVVWGRNMVVAGNTNFVAATDGQVFNTANYSATFGDAPINRAIGALTAGFGNTNWVENAFTIGSDNVNGWTATGTGGSANAYSNSVMWGLQNRGIGSRNTVGGAFLFANSASGDITIFGKGIDASNRLAVTTPASFNVGYGSTTPQFQITANKTRIDDARFEEFGVSLAVASANDLTLTNGNRFTISGATQINAITTANWQDGSKVWFIFTGAPLVKNNTAGGAGTATILLAGRVDFQASVGDILYLGYNGTNWYELNRALATSPGGGSLTSFSFTDANGFDGTVVTPTTTPNLTLTTTLALGSVFFAGSGGAINEDNANLFFENTNNTLGIGVNSSFAATRLAIVDNAVGANSIVSVTSTSTAAASNLQKGINVSLSGANANGSQSTFGIDASNTHTAALTNVAIRGKTSGATNNYGVVGESNGTGNSAGVYGYNLSTGYGGWFQTTGSGTGVRAEADAGPAVNGTSSSNIGVMGSSSSQAGVYGASTSGSGVLSYVNPSSTNTSVVSLAVTRGTTGTPAAGLGAKIQWKIDDDTFESEYAGEISHYWTDVAHATRSSSTNFLGFFNGSAVDFLTLGGDGSVKLRPITATAASAITAAEGMIVIVNTTNGTFTSTGFWGYSGGAWAKF